MSLSTICKVMEPFDSNSRPSTEIFSVPLSCWIQPLGEPRNPSERAGYTPPSRREKQEQDAGALGAALETTVSVLKRDPTTIQRSHLHRILSRIDEEGLDLVGLRIFYPSTRQSVAIDEASTWSPRPLTPSLALAVRGVGAQGRWASAVGPDDPLVARKTDPRSLRATLGTDRDDNVLTCARVGGASWSTHEMPLYFGGRIPDRIACDGAAAALANLDAMESEPERLPAVACFAPSSALVFYDASSVGVASCAVWPTCAA